MLLLQVQAMECLSLALVAALQWTGVPPRQDIDKSGVKQL